MKVIRTGPIAVFQRNKYLYDVFTGEGWENYSQFRVVKGFPKLVQGTSVTEFEYKEITKCLQ